MLPSALIASFPSKLGFACIAARSAVENAVERGMMLFTVMSLNVYVVLVGRISLIETLSIVADVVTPSFLANPIESFVAVNSIVFDPVVVNVPIDDGDVPLVKVSDT